MKILVTGGSGFVGSCLCLKLKAEGYETFSYDLYPSNISSYLVGSITDWQTVFQAVKKCDYVFHLAAIANVDHARLHPEVAMETNIQGTYLVAKACKELRVPLSFASTACVYGNTPNHPSTEESICVPTDLYGATKVVGENIVKGFDSSSNIMRFGTIYGHGMREALAVYVFIKQALEGKTLTIHGSGNQTRCMIYIDDLVDAQAKILEKDVSGKTLNLATDEELSVLQIADIILKSTKKRASLKFVEDRPGQIMKEQIDISKAKKLLGWCPKIGFEEGIRKTVRWYLSQKAH